MKRRRTDWEMDYKIPLFTLFTRYAYRINVHRNDYMIVQQAWLRKAMSKLLGYDIKKIIVSPPAFRPLPIPGRCPVKPGMTEFIYPATADVHKDFETLCEAARLLEGRLGSERFKVTITVKGDENRYARWLKKQWGDISSIDFHGLMPRDELAAAFGSADCMVFPSRAETWGLPISEFKPTGKPMIIADLPYAHETATGAQKVAFFPVSDAEKLANVMQAVVENDLSDFRPVDKQSYEKPYAENWEQLFDLLLQ